MKYYRSFLVTFSFMIFGIGSMLINFTIFPIAKLFLSEIKYINMSSFLIHKLWIVFVKYMEIIRLIKVNVKNADEIRNIKNKIIVATHPSFADILILMSLIPKSTCFVKNSFAKNFVFANIVNSIFIPNDIEIEELCAESKKYLDKDFNVIIFPMGVRHRKNEYPKIKKGASLIALNAKKNIVPIKIYSSEDFVFANQPFWAGGEKTVEFSIEIGKTIEIADFINEDDIIAKRNLTKEITNSLYK